MTAPANDPLDRLPRWLPAATYALLTIIVFREYLFGAPGTMLYLGCGRDHLPLRAVSDSALLLLGGEPFDEKIIMWWNFIGRTGEEIKQAREDWMASDRFGTVRGYEGDPLAAPELPDLPLKARGRIR